MMTELVNDREHDSSREADAQVPVAIHQHPRLQLARIVEAQGMQMPTHRLGIPRSKANTEAFTGGGVEAAALEIRTGFAPEGRVGELRPKPFGRRGEQLPMLFVRIGRVRSRGLVDHLNPDPLPDHLHRANPIKAEALSQEGEDITALVADEAVIGAALGGD